MDGETFLYSDHVLLQAAMYLEPPPMNKSSTHPITSFFLPLNKEMHSLDIGILLTSPKIYNTYNIVPLR